MPIVAVPAESRGSLSIRECHVHDRAMIQNGQIHPLDPLPEEWTEGRQVIVEDAQIPSSDDLEEWYHELQELGPAQYEPGECERV
jgi:hypothetical protein